MEKVRLGDVCTIKGGYAFKSDQFSTEGVPVIRIGNITKEGLTIDEDVCYDKKFWNENDSYRIAKNDILIAMSGATVGKSCINNTERNLLLNQRVAAINCDNNINLKYIFYSIGSEKFSKYIMTNSIGCAQPNISLKQIANFEIPAVCLEEQNRIADELDKVTDVINKRKQQISKLDELVKARFVELLNDSEKEVRLDDLISPYKPEKCGNNTYPVLSITMRNGLMLQSDRFKKEIASGDKSQYKVVPRNKLVVAFPIDEGLLSAQTIVDAGIVSPAYNLYSIDESKVMPKVLEYILRSDKSIQYYLSKLRGTTLRRRMIPKEDFYSMPIQLPTIDRQKQFLSEVNQVDKSKLEVQKSLEKLELLKKALMQKYFG